MIDIERLRKEDVGAWVLFRGRELGRIKSWNERYIYVVYHCDNEWERFEEFTAAPTVPEDLDFANREMQVVCKK